MISRKRSILNIAYLINVLSFILSAAFIYDLFGIWWLMLGITFFPGMWLLVPFYAAFSYGEFWPLILLMFGVIIPIHWVISNPHEPD
jgi:hypothetical protein